MSTAADTATTIKREAGRRRTFAVISHPDAGKSTLTESLALYGQAINDAGVTHGKSSRHGTVSDWMGMEQERGISISSAALQFEYRGMVLNLVDTPGHADFSEDTYRVLAAVDCAVMLIDAAKGFEAQTEKLLNVCLQRRLPIVTVINKWDRPGMEALSLLDEIGARTGMAPVPVTWPAGIAGEFTGLISPGDGRAFSLEGVDGGAKRARETPVEIDSLSGPEAADWQTAREESALVLSAHGAFDPARFAQAEQTPVLFTAAARNFGVLQLLDTLADLAPSAAPRSSHAGEPRPLDSGFSGFIFKVQSGQNSAHRDHIAFMRVCSGVFDRGMVVTNPRTGRPFATKYVHRVLGRSREVVDTAWPGDIVGLVNAAALQVGDTLYGEDPVRFPPIPHFAPEHFKTARAKDPGRYKQFRRGIQQLDHEGVVQVLRSDLRGDQSPVLAAVGPLQFEVAAQRLEQEFNAPASLETLSYTMARRLDGLPDDGLVSVMGSEVLYRPSGEAVAVFTDRWKLGHFVKANPAVGLVEIGAGTMPTQ